MIQGTFSDLCAIQMEIIVKGLNVTNDSNKIQLLLNLRQYTTFLTFESK